MGQRWRRVHRGRKAGPPENLRRRSVEKERVTFGLGSCDAIVPQGAKDRVNGEGLLWSFVAEAQISHNDYYT